MQKPSSTWLSSLPTHFKCFLPPEHGVEICVRSLCAHWKAGEYFSGCLKFPKQQCPPTLDQHFVSSWASCTHSCFEKSCTICRLSHQRYSVPIPWHWQFVPIMENTGSSSFTCSRAQSTSGHQPCHVFDSSLDDHLFIHLVNISWTATR